MSEVLMGSEFPSSLLMADPQYLRGTLSKESLANTGTIKMRAEVGRATAEQMAEWTKGQIAYPNLSYNEEIAERALAYVRDVKRHYLDVTTRVRKQGELLSKQMRGNSLASMGDVEIIHSPEIHKRVERIVPRLEEMMFGNDPPFRVRGRNEMTRDQALTILAFMLWQQDAGNLAELVQPAIRSMLTHRFSMYYVWWSREFDWRVIREVGREFVDGRNEWKSRRAHARVLTFDGPRWKLIDPTSAIIDVRHLLEDDMDFIGHESTASWRELKSLQEMGFYQGVDKIDPGTASVYQEQEKRARSLTPEAVSFNKRPANGPKSVQLTTLFGRWDLYGDGVERECMFVVANDSTVLRVSENPYDDKIRPYACGVASKDGFEFFGSVGPLDHSLSLNNALDKLRTIGFRTAQFNMTPIFTSDDGEEMVDTLSNVEPGTRIGGGKLSQLQIGNTLDSLLQWSEILNADIDEATGAPPIYGGTDDSNTATQAVKNLSEANKRMRGYMRAQSRQYERLFELQHSLNRQFVHGDVTFRVLGKTAHILGVPYATVNPETFLPEVDFDFVALDGIFNSMTRATGMQNWLTVFSPLLPLIPGVNVPKLAKSVWDGMVGGTEDDDIIRVTPMLDELVPQSEENQSLLQGMPMKVNQNDPHDMHMAELLPAIEVLTRPGANPRAIKAVMDHWKEHMIAMGRQENARAAQAGFLNPSPPAARQPDAELENQTQGRDGDQGLDGTSVAQTPTMETPGPGTGQQIAAPGGKVSSPQSSNAR